MLNAIGRRMVTGSRVLAASPQARRLVLVLLVLDLVLLIAHFFYDPTAEGLRNDVRLRLDKDRGFAEVAGYLQLLAASGGLTWLCVSARSTLDGAWAAVLVVIVIDDSLSLHERAGTAAGRARDGGTVIGIPAQELAELATFGLLGLFSVGLVAAAHQRTRDSLRASTWTLLPPVALLVATGVGVDVLQQVTDGALASMLKIAEDGGELIAMSLVLLATVSLVLERSRLASPEEHGAEVAAAPGNPLAQDHAQRSRAAGGGGSPRDQLR